MGRKESCVGLWGGWEGGFRGALRCHRETRSRTKERRRKTKKIKKKPPTGQKKTKKTEYTDPTSSTQRFEGLRCQNGKKKKGGPGFVGKERPVIPDTREKKMVQEGKLDRIEGKEEGFRQRRFSETKKIRGTGKRTEERPIMKKKEHADWDAWQRKKGQAPTGNPCGDLPATNRGGGKIYDFKGICGRGKKGGTSSGGKKLRS